MTSNRTSAFAAMLFTTLLVAACGGGSDSADDSTETDVDEQTDEGSGETNAIDDDPAEPADEAPPEDAGEVAVSDNDVIDPVYHHVSAEAPEGSWGPRCNTDNQGDWAPGWRVSVPTDWQLRGTSGSSSIFDIRFEAPDGSSVTIDWAESVDSFGYTDGTVVGDIDFDGETVALMDSSDETNQILAIDFVAQSAGGLVEVLGGPVISQVSVLSTVEMGLSQDDATAILTSMRRERCAIFAALALENGFQRGVTLPIFEGGDPLDKTAPTSERLPFDPATGINPFQTYTQDQLAYVVGFDQATSDCFVANIFPTLPADLDAFLTFLDPITPEDDPQSEALEAALAGC